MRLFDFEWENTIVFNLEMNSSKTISLFSGSGFGDIGFRSAGLAPVLLAEIDPRRAQLAQVNIPTAWVMAADVLEEASNISKAAHSLLGGDDLFLLSATPPCQGMSKNGIGTLLRSVERELRPKVDPRNALYIPAIQMVRELRPRWFFFENVCRMMNTYGLGDDGKSYLLPEIIESELRTLGYGGRFEQVQLADYGLPQTRLRTVGLFRRDAPEPDGTYLPTPTHAQKASTNKMPWVTLKDAIGHLPSVDSKNRRLAESQFHPLHRVPIWRPDLYRWMAATPEGCSALDNTGCSQCELSNSNTAVLCAGCGQPLPRPSVTRDGVHRLIKGFPSSYKRMKWSKPGSTVTTRSAYACSDHKVHPSQNRVLTTLEVAILQGIDPDQYNPSTDGATVANDTLLRDVIGECVPPLFAAQLGRHMMAIENGAVQKPAEETQLTMF